MKRTFKRELCNLSKEEKKYLLDNMWYRHHLYNKGIEIIRDAKSIITNQYVSKIALIKILQWYIETVENKDYYCKDIHQIVAKELNIMLYDVYNNGKYYSTIEQMFKFKKFNKFYRSFGIPARSYKSKKGTNTSRIKSFTNNSITIRFSKGNYRTYYIKESSWNNRNHPYKFNMYDIKEIFFTYDHGKFFISLSCEVEFDNPYKKHDNREELAGIDLGERNPAMIYDGKEYIKVKFPDKKIKYLQNKINRLNQILSGKVYGSNNYYKVLMKINKLYKKQVHIRLDWRNKQAYMISNLFKTIIVDEFDVPVITKNDTNSEIIGKKKHDINRVMLGRGMWLFMNALKNQSEKYHCNYIKALPLTTCTCSKCGHVNEPLPLSEEYLVCDNCGRSIHRDKNAANNCYYQHSYRIFINT